MRTDETKRSEDKGATGEGGEREGGGGGAGNVMRRAGGGGGATEIKHLAQGAESARAGPDWTSHHNNTLIQKYAIDTQHIRPESFLTQTI